VDDFKSLVESVNAVDPGSHTYRCIVAADRANLGDFVRRMVAVLGLLDSTANALAEIWRLVAF
jgi:hypothetical protein